MAFTDVSSDGAQGGLGKVIASAIVQFHKANVCAPLFTGVACSPGTNVAQFPVYAKEALSGVQTSASGAEETTGTSVAIETNAVTAEVFRNNIYTEVKDLAAHGNADALLVNVGRVLGNAVAAHFDEEGCALFDASTNGVGGAAVHNNLGILFDAVGTLEANDAPRDYNAVLHPLQVYGNHGITEDLNASAGITPGTVADSLVGPGFVTQLGGIGIYTSPQVPATSDQRKGGVFSKTAFGYGFIDQGGGSFIQIETDRNAPAAATQIVANGYFNSLQLVDLHCVEVHTEVS